MRQLRIRDFSCIEEATLEVAQFTILIGPQASGKSVLSKLVYFFINLLSEQRIIVEEGKDLDDFKDHIRQSFKEWFPSSAWGKKKFCIEFCIGTFEIRLTRTDRKGKLSDNIRVWMSSDFEQHYKFLRVSAAAVVKRASRSPGRQPDFEITWKLRQESEKRMKALLGNDYIEFQLFIPAGRSFFTSLGKAVAVFEQGKILDPLTVRFGRFFTSLREYSWRRVRTSKFFEGQMSQLLGGKIKFERDREYVDTQDGRRIPFSALSSGQQEILPLLLAVETWGPTFGDSKGPRRLIYIEEPEAHLFPSAQSLLIQMLASLVARSKWAVKPISKQLMGLVLTTHSPYVLSKINNLIKAGTLAEKANEETRGKIAAIVDKSAWLSHNLVKAYAIRNAKLSPIMDSSGLIDAEYLDDVSGEIAKEFSALLEIEISHVP